MDYKQYRLQLHRMNKNAKSTYIFCRARELNHRPVDSSLLALIHSQVMNPLDHNANRFCHVCRTLYTSCCALNSKQAVARTKTKPTKLLLLRAIPMACHKQWLSSVQSRYSLAQWLAAL